MFSKYEVCVQSLERVVDAEGADDDAWDEFEGYFEKFLDFSWCSNWDGTKYDIVFYGVSGYTGYLTMQYLKRVALKKNPEPFTFAVSGRTASKVAEMRDREFGGTKWEDTPIIRASYDDVVSVIDLAKSAHVIINVAGPYMLTQGEILIDACIRNGTHYCDVSGEIPWSKRCVDLHERAKKTNAKICPSAAVAGGYPDFLVSVCAKSIRENYGEELRKGYCYATGGGAVAGASGGTLASRNAMSGNDDEVRKLMADPFALGGFIPEIDRNGIKEITVKQGTGASTLKQRREDQDSVLSKIQEDKTNNMWLMPHTYAYFDTRMMRRTNALLADMIGQPYGKSFNYTQFGILPQEVNAAASAARAAGKDATQAVNAFLAGSGASAAANVEEEKKLLQEQGKFFAQGQGPDLDSLSDAWLAMFCEVESVTGKKQKACFCGGDGYFETARAAVETAMCLRFDQDKLQIQSGGVLTAAATCGHLVVQRIIASGIKFKMGEWFHFSELGPPEGAMGN